MKVADAMTRSPWTIRPGDSVPEALHLMLEARISGLPVVNADGTLAGMITEGDFLRRAELGTERQHSKLIEFLLGPGRLAQEYVGSHGRRVEEVMTSPVVTIEENAPLAEAVRLMEHHHVKRLPVVRHGRLCGILSRADLLRALVSTETRPSPGKPSDEAIRQRIEAEIDLRPWGPRTTVRVAVNHGVVDLGGVILDERTRQALRVVAENVPGVVAVHDRLTTVEPVTGVLIEAPLESPAGPPP